jgi:hypothetical protein
MTANPSDRVRRAEKHPQNIADDVADDDVEVSDDGKLTQRERGGLDASLLAEDKYESDKASQGAPKDASASSPDAVAHRPSSYVDCPHRWGI